MKDKKEGLIPRRKLCQIVTLSTTNPTWNCLVANPDPIDESQATNTIWAVALHGSELNVGLKRKVFIKEYWMYA